MAGEWTDTTLGDICELRAGSVFPPALQGKTTGTYPFAKVSDMNLAANAACIHDANNWVDDADLLQLKAKPFPAGTTVFAKIGEALKANRLRFLVRPTIIDNNMMGAVPAGKDVDARFLFYALSQFDFGEIAGGTALPYLTVGALSQLEIALPPLPEQRAIAHILASLDDKIELNRQSSETLEAVARALFKSWFVDFDPVHAKADGRDPGLPKHIADLFPDSIEDSELGEIPRGWEVWRVGDIGRVVCGKTPPTNMPEYYGNDLPFVTIPDMHGNIFVVTAQKWLSRAGAESQPNKTLPPGSICVSCIATPGLVVMITQTSQTNQQINSVIPREASHTYYWFWILHDLGNEIQVGGSGGSVINNLSTGRFSQLSVIASTADLRQSYHSQVAPILEKILANTIESGTLAVVRDTLLPKLISGELRIPQT
jgi:type I restriction enzyme S subunit